MDGVGQEVAGRVNEFECSLEVMKGDHGKKPDCRHHEQRKEVQEAFKKQVKSLGPLRSKPLLAFHSIIGCDRRRLHGKYGKSTKTVTPALHALSSSPSQKVVEDVMPQIERFIVLMYDKASECSTVNDARKDLYKKRQKLRVHSTHFCFIN